MQAALRIENGPLVGRPAHLQTSGREQMQSSEFVDVQLSGIFPKGVNGIERKCNGTVERDVHVLQTGVMLLLHRVCEDELGDVEVGPLGLVTAI